MNRLLIVIILISNSFIALSVNKTESDKIIRRVDLIEDQLKEVRRDELNYQIEKDLLKETYGNNYDRISLIITIVLGIIGLLGYLGIRDIYSIKKEYESELQNLKKLQNDFNSKVLEFDTEKRRFDTDLKEIIKQNEEQNRKIKFIELKDKVRTLLEGDKLYSALEFANAALQINDKDPDLLNNKGQILCRLNQISDAVKVYKEALQSNPENDLTISNAVECFYFANDINTAKTLIDKHKSLFEDKCNGELIKFFKVIELYHLSNVDELKSMARLIVNSENLNECKMRLDGWNLKEAFFFAHYQKDGEMKTILQNILRYFDGKIAGDELLTRLG